MHVHCPHMGSQRTLTAAPGRAVATCRQRAHIVPLQSDFCRRRCSVALSRPALSTRSRALRAFSVVSGPVEKLDAEQLEVAIQERNKPLIIDFYATWCGPCLLLAKELEQVYETMGDSIRIVKVDTDENPDLSSQLQIQGLPTMVFVGLDRNKPALRTEGLLPADTIMDIIRTELMEEQAIDVGATAVE